MILLYFETSTKRSKWLNTDLKQKLIKVRKFSFYQTIYHVIIQQPNHDKYDFLNFAYKLFGSIWPNTVSVVLERPTRFTCTAKLDRVIRLSTFQSVYPPIFLFFFSFT